MKRSTIWLITVFLISTTTITAGCTSESPILDALNPTPNGVYTDQEGLNVVVIDETRTDSQFISWQSSHNSLTTAKTVSATRGHLKAHEVVKINADVHTSKMDIDANVRGFKNKLNLKKSHSTSALKTFKTEPPTIQDITGVHSGNGSNILDISENGQFTLASLNNGCVFDGHMYEHNGYFNVTNATATECDDDSYNGEYNSGLFAVNFESEIAHIKSVLYMDDKVKWSTTKLF